MVFAQLPPSERPTVVQTSAREAPWQSQLSDDRLQDLIELAEVERVCWPEGLDARIAKLILEGRRRTAAATESNLSIHGVQYSRANPRTAGPPDFGPSSSDTPSPPSDQIGGPAV